METVSRHQLERVCRMYSTNEAAARALGLSRQGLYRLCRRLGVASPAQRRRRRLITH